MSKYIYIIIIINIYCYAFLMIMNLLSDNSNNVSGEAVDIYYYNMIIIISVGSVSLLLLALSYTVFTLVITALVRGKAKLQRELKQVRDASSTNTRASYEEIELNVVTEDNVAYGRVR